MVTDIEYALMAGRGYQSNRGKNIIDLGWLTAIAKVNSSLEELGTTYNRSVEHWKRFL